jgi:hypothetical protein
VQYGLSERPLGHPGPRAPGALLKVAFIQKVLVHSSLTQIYKTYYFPVLEFKNCWILKGSNPVTRGSEGTPKAKIRLNFAS